MTGLVSGLAVIDVDHPKQADPILIDLLPDSVPIPTVQTPSGGKHYYFTITDDKLSNNARIIPGADLRANGGYVVAPPSIGANGMPYAWLPGLSIHDYAPPSMPDAYLRAIKGEHSNNNFLTDNKNNNSLCKGPVTSVTLSFAKGSRDNDLFHVANCLVKGGMPDNEILQTLVPLASACKPPFPLDELEAKILSAIKRQEHREFNLTREVERYISVTDGDFSVTECDKALQSMTGVTIRDKSTIRQIFKRLKDAGKIQKVGSKDGVYRRLDDVAEEIDWFSASMDPLKINFPLGIEECATIYPKNIIVIAGEPNAGKTAFMLNVAVMNSGKHKVTYLSSEMGAIELKNRINKFQDIPLSAWKAIKFKERSGNFADVLDPNGFTIIDFLEITDDFYRIATFIKEIHDRLDSGICVIGIQKNKGRDSGRGGELGLEKPRLYLAMEQGKIKIVKAKAWAKEGVNPNGLQKEFKLIQGAKFIEATPWHKQGEI